MLYRFLIEVRNKPELIILGIMVLVIGMLIMPLPTYIVDFLIALNIIISLLIFMSTFYITQILGFTTFPALLLLTTLFRLALSISTSRLILLDADAGDIIMSFGQFVIGDNLVVGFVVFAIVTVVQFVVITKGSERVAEVAARFSLDGMPGKQMSIDADLKSGVIDNEGVKIRRRQLEQESQLYGSFDGAMKFIKGDAIAGIVIIFVNFIGGISVGMAQMGMGFSEAMSTYTMLTIGDGLVAQIPALLISISAGFMVTRVGGSEKNLGHNMISELFSHNFSLVVTACLALSIGLLPGFPVVVFLLLACLIGGLSFYRFYAKRQTQKNDSREVKKTTARRYSEPTEAEVIKSELNFTSLETIPLIISVSKIHQAFFEEKAVDIWLKKEMLMKFGLMLPEFIISYSENMPENKMVILINEIRSAVFSILFEEYRVLSNVEEIKGLKIEIREITSDNGEKTFWVSQEERDRLTELGYRFSSGIEELFSAFSITVTRNISEFFGVQEAKNLLDEMEIKYPELLKECYRHLSIQRITEVLQRLMLEQVSIRNIKVILGGLVQWGPKEKDTIMLVEHVRALLARYISDRFSFNNKLNVFLLSAEIEETIRQGIRQSSGGSFLNLEPSQVDYILDRFAVAIERQIMLLHEIVVLTSVDTRRFVKKLFESQYPQLTVLSFSEISEGTNVDVIKTI